MRRLPVRAALLASSLVLVAAPAATAAESGLHATTVRDGMTFTSTLSAPKGTSGKWYVIAHDASVKPQTTLAISIGRYPRTKSLSVTIPDSAFGTGCSLLVQVDVRFGGTRHNTTQFVPGGVRRVTITKPDCKPAQPPPPTVVPPTVVTRPPASTRGVKAAFVARAVPASVTFTG